MKTRNDFVSNSSSCSFVVSVKHREYPFGDFVEDLVADCRSSAEQEYDTPESMARLDEMNRRNLLYHLKASELLFLGELEVGGRETSLKKADDEQWFSTAEKLIDSNEFELRSGCRLESRTGDEIRVSYPEQIGEIAVPSSSMAHITGHYGWPGEKDDKPEGRKTSADRIFAYAKSLSEGENQRPESNARLWNPELYFISKETVRNTRCLLEAGYRLKLDKWEDLDDIERRLEAGESLYHIRQNNGGDGMDDFTVYGLGGWDAGLGSRAVFETLTCGD